MTTPTNREGARHLPETYFVPEDSDQRHIVENNYFGEIARAINDLNAKSPYPYPTKCIYIQDSLPVNDSSTLHVYPLPGIGLYTNKYKFVAIYGSIALPANTPNFDKCLYPFPVGFGNNRQFINLLVDVKVGLAPKVHIISTATSELGTGPFPFNATVQYYVEP